jgi:hypothetical protein
MCKILKHICLEARYSVKTKKNYKSQISKKNISNSVFEEEEE